MEGSGVYWYPHQRAYCSAFKNWPGYINASIDIFFNKQTLTASSAMGNKKKSKKGSTHQPLNPLIIQAPLGKFYWIQIQYAFFNKVFSTVTCMLNLPKSIFSGVNTFWSIHTSKWSFFFKSCYPHKSAIKTSPFKTFDESILLFVSIDLRLLPNMRPLEWKA